MNIIFTLEDFNTKNVYFFDKIKNNIINGLFIKIHYSTSYFSLNNILIEIPYTNISSYCYKSNQVYNVELTNQTINCIKNIEKDIINNYCLDKIPNYKIDEITKHKNIIKIFKMSSNENNNNNPLKVILKISGLWLNNTHYGLTYKFIHL